MSTTIDNPAREPTPHRASGWRPAAAGPATAASATVHVGSSGGLGLALACALGVAPPFGWLVAGSLVAASIAQGIIISALNVWILQRVVRSLSQPTGVSSFVALALPFKFAGVVAAGYALVRLGLAAPLPLAAGFAVLPLALAVVPPLARLFARLSPSSE